MLLHKTLHLHYSYRWLLETVFRGYSSIYQDLAIILIRRSDGVTPKQMRAKTTENHRNKSYISISFPHEMNVLEDMPTYRYTIHSETRLQRKRKGQDFFFCRQVTLKTVNRNYRFLGLRKFSARQGFRSIQFRLRQG